MRVSNLVLPDIREALHAETTELSDALADFHAADLAEIINDLDEEDTPAAASRSARRPARFFDYLDATRRASPLHRPCPLRRPSPSTGGGRTRHPLRRAVGELSAAPLARMPAEESRSRRRWNTRRLSAGIMTTEFPLPARPPVPSCSDPAPRGEHGEHLHPVSPAEPEPPRRRRLAARHPDERPTPPRPGVHGRERGHGRAEID